MDKFLVTGGTGFFGLNFIRNPSKNIYLLGNQKQLKKKNSQIFFLDEFSKKNLITFIKNKKIKVIIHAAAVTNLEFAEKNKLLTYNSNFRLTKTISDISKNLNLKLVFISTDQLYNSYKGYSRENQKISILNYYSHTKYLAENYIKKNNKNFWILRCSFFGLSSSNKMTLSEFIIQNISKKKNINLWDNVFFNPLYVSELIDISKKITNYEIGIYNLGTKNKISKYEFGLLLAKKFKLNPKYIKKINYEDKLVTRPKNMSVDIKKVSNIFSNKSFEIKSHLNFLYNDYINFKKELSKY